MTLTEILLELVPYSRILITGPQRSGTTISAHIISEALGLNYIDEDAFEVYNLEKARDYFLRDGVVIQSPGLCYIADRIATEYDFAIVIMRRDLAEIHASEERIGWKTAFGGANVLAEVTRYQARFGYSLPKDSIAETKYFVWDTYQRDKCLSFDLDYASLSTHPLWKPIPTRRAFSPRQWS